MLNKIKYLIVGSPIPTKEMKHSRLSNLQALAALSPGAIASFTYANQEIFLALAAAGSEGLSQSFRIGVFVSVVLFLVATSYYQVIQSYPSGGGSYSVAFQNLGTNAGLVTASTLLIDYLLTAAVSLTTAIAQLVSAFPMLWPYRVGLALFLLLIITIINLRGMKEAGTLMAVPVYLFLAVFFGLMIYGFFKTPGAELAVVPSNNISSLVPVNFSLILGAFAFGLTALTGIEAISNSVPGFKPPEEKNAGKTLMIMAGLMMVLFLGSLWLIYFLKVRPNVQETVISALTRNILGEGAIYIVVQLVIMLLLAVAANTSFAGFPTLAANLAKDKFLPRNLTSLGDRLEFRNGILILSFTTAILIIAFDGDSHALVPLFAIAVFSTFTLSQIGMTVHWLRNRISLWWLKALFNAVGGLATGVATCYIGYSSFLQGAWITVILVPMLVAMFRRIKKHYSDVSKQLSLKGLPPSLRPVSPSRVVVPISGVHRGVVRGINFARSISDNVTAVYVELEPGAREYVQKEWERWWPELTLDVIESPYRSIVGPLLDYLDELDAQNNDGQRAVVVLPEFVPVRTWQYFLHNQTALFLKTALIYRRKKLRAQRVIIDVPFYLKH